MIFRLEALKNYFLENKRRFFLSLVGIAVGTLSLVVMSGITSAMKRKVVQSIGELGAKSIAVVPGDVRNLGGRVVQVSFYTTLKEEDLEAINEKCSFVRFSAPIKKVSPTIHANGKSFSGEVLGTTPEMALIENLKLKCGRFLSEDDIRNISQVAVIGHRVAVELFGSECPLGQTLFLYNAPYTIIGVAERRGTDISGNDLDSRVYIPVSSALRRLSNEDFLNQILVVPQEGKGEEVESCVLSLLEKRHGTKDFTVGKYEEIVNARKKAIEIFSTLSITVAFIAFSVGAFGILGVMVLSVYDRMLEIGLRRTFGAKREQIFLQFLMESAVVSTFGAILGITVGAVITALVTKLANWGTFIPIKGMTVSLILSVIVGVVSGVYPAVRALQFEPKKVLEEQ